MFYDHRRSVPESPLALQASYVEDFVDAVETAGIEGAASETSLDEDTLRSIVGEPGAPEGAADLTLEQAAELVALDPDVPDDETIVELACEHLLLGMSAAVLDVDTLASHLDLDLDSKEIQQKIERRAPMTFEEFVHLQYVIADRIP